MIPRATVLAALASVAAAAAGAQTADAGPRPIGLPEAIRLAQANAPAAVQARGQTRTGEADLRSAWSAFIPSLTVNLGTSVNSPGNRTDINTGLTTPGKYKTSQGFSLNLDLMEGGRRLYNLSAARAQLGAAEAGEAAERWQIAYLVKQQYYAVLAALEARRAALSALDQATEQMKSAVLKVQARAATKSDTLRSLVQMGNARLGILAADNDLRSANASLTRLVAAPSPVTALSEDTLAQESFTDDSVLLAKLALEGPAVRQATASLQAAQSSAQSAHAAYYPSISMSYSRNHLGSDTAFTFVPLANQFSGQFTVGISYPIFNQYSRERNAVIAEVAAKNADAALRDAQFAAQQNVVQYLGALRTARQQVAIQTVSVAAAEEDLRVQQQRYDLGASTILDVLTSQTTLNQARVILIQARFTYRVAKAQLEALVGRDL